MSNPKGSEGAGLPRKASAFARGTATRIIPCLDIKGGRVVKGVRLKTSLIQGSRLSFPLGMSRGS